MRPSHGPRPSHEAVLTVAHAVERVLEHDGVGVYTAVEIVAARHGLTHTQVHWCWKQLT
jgi:hypothetical protein